MDLPLQLFDATLEDKHFVGWFLNGKKITVIDETLCRNIFIEGNFEDIYKITYTGIGSELVENPTEYYDSSDEIALNLPTKEGYIFKGWSLNGFTVTSIPSATKGDITLSTVYDYVKYNITYELDGGINNENNKPTYTLEVPYTPLKEPTKDGYNFLGWLLDGEIVTNINNERCEDVVVYATWELAPIYHNIYYNLNGGKVPTGTPTTYEEGKEHVLAMPTKEGYNFLGWNTSKDGKGETITKIDKTSTNDITVYAIWEKIVVISNIIYNLNGGTFVESVKTTYEEGTNYTLPTPTKEGYKFIGWYTNSNFEGNKVEEITEYTKGDQTFYACFELDKEVYTITYNLNGGTFAKEVLYNTRTEMTNDFINDYNAYYGAKTTIAGFFDDSYNYGILENFFKSNEYKEKWGWMKQYIIDVCSENGYSGLSSLIDENDSYHNNFLRANVHAFINANYRSEWPKSLDYSPVAIANGYITYLPGTSQEIIYEFTSLTENYTLPNVVRNEYTFIGWYDESDNLITEISAGTEKNIILNAKFKSIYEIYSITYNTNGGTLGSDAITEYIEKDNVILPTPSKLGYNFYGWYETSDFSTQKVTEIPVGNKGNKTYYAYFIKIDYTIKYDIPTDNPTKYNVDTPTFKLLPVEKQGYEFVGWYTSSGQLVEEIIVGSTGNLVLVAKYKVIVDETIKYTVTFIDENGELFGTQEVSHGTSASEILLGTYQGLDLAWYCDGNLYDFDQLLTSDITLNAYWRVIDDIFNTVFVEEVITKNVVMEQYFQTTMGEITASWKTSNSEILNTITGVVNPDYEDQIIKITGTFKINGVAMTISREVIVGKVNFKDLTNIQPVFGYFYSRMASSVVDEVAGATLDVINYGFARVTSEGTVDISELRYLEKILQLRQRGIRVLLCIGGYGTACKEFSDASYTKEGREKLAASILSVIEEYHFDGVDIDWEYPGYQTGRDVSIDRPNYTLLMAEIRRQLKAANPEYLVTAAIPGGKYGYTRYELGKLNSILDYFHLMTYDLQASGSATHHTGLFSGNGTPHGSVKQTVDTFSSNGVSKNKLVVGLAFYGRKFNTSSYKVGSTSSTTSASSITYTDIYNNYLVPIQNGSTTIKRYWDDTTKAPYIYDSSTRVWITYDDPESIKAKCEYVKAHNLGGVMFWDYGEDQTYQLIYAIHDNFR